MCVNLYIFLYRQLKYFTIILEMVYVDSMHCRMIKKKLNEIYTKLADSILEITLIFLNFGKGLKMVI